MKWPPKLSPLPDEGAIPEEDQSLLEEARVLRADAMSEANEALAVEKEMRRRRGIAMSLARRYEDKVLRLHGQMELPLEEQQ